MIFNVLFYLLLLFRKERIERIPCSSLVDLGPMVLSIAMSLDFLSTDLPYIFLHFL